MGQINVKGLGVVNIAGDEPTPNEIDAIKDKLKDIQLNSIVDKPAEESTDAFLNDFSWGRLVTEAGLAIAGSVATGGLALPGLAARAGFLAKPFLKQLAKASAGSGIGAGTGAAVAQSFDPREDVVQEITRAATEGALAEAVGAPLFIKGSQVMSKFLAKDPKTFKAYLDGAKEAEDSLKLTADKILANPKSFAKQLGIPEEKIEDLVQSAKIFKEKGLTPGVKTTNRTVEILQNIGEKSLVGGGELTQITQAGKNIGEIAAKDLLSEFRRVADKEELGLLFLDSIRKGGNAFRTESDRLYGLVDETLGARKFDRIIPVTNLDSKLKQIIDNVELKGDSPVVGIFSNIRKQIAEREGLYSFKQLNNLRGELSERLRGLGYGAGKSQSQLAQAMDEIDNILKPDFLTKAVPNFPTEALSNLRAANKFYFDGAELFQRGILQGILKNAETNPQVIDKVFSKIVSTSDNSFTVGKIIDEIDNMAKLPIGKDTAITLAQAATLKGSLKGQFLSDIISKSTKGTEQFGSFVDAKLFDDALRKRNLTLGKLFSPKEVKQIRQLESNLAFAQGQLTRSPGLPGGVFIQLKQAGAAGKVIGVGQTLAIGGAGAVGGLLPALGILAAPVAFNKMLLSKWFQNKLFKEPAKLIAKGELTPSKAAVIYRQIVGRMFTEGYIPEGERDRQFGEIDAYERGIREGGTQVEPQRSSLNLPQINNTNLGLGTAPLNPRTRAALAGNDPILQGIAAQQPTQLNRGGIVSAKKTNT